MKFKFVLCVAGFAVFLCGPAKAQDPKTGSWGSVGAGYIFQTSETSNSNWIGLHGWYVLPTFNITKQIGVFGDFANLYHDHQNIHVDLFGPFHAFGNRTRFTPFIFTGVGRIRDSNASTVANSLAWFAGAGMMVRLTRWVSFETIPVEYVMNTAGWNVGNNFDARAGFAITIPK